MQYKVNSVFYQKEWGETTNFEAIKKTLNKTTLEVQKFINDLIKKGILSILINNSFTIEKEPTIKKAKQSKAKK